MIFDGLYDHVDYTPDFANWYQEWYDENDYNNKVYGLLQEDAEFFNKERTIHNKKHKFPRLTRVQYTTHTTGDEEHNLMHLPYRDWCKHCIQGKSKSQHHQRGGLTKQSITQIDYGVTTPTSEAKTTNTTLQ
eukprot:3115142-Amphidinium_carterae.1